MAGERNDIEVDDIAQMRAMVHPARWTVLMALYQGEPLTATRAAELTGFTPSAMSYHLQQLAKMGLIERAPASGDGRERPWRARGTGLHVSAQPDEFVGGVMMRYLMTALAKVVAVPPPADPAQRPWPASYAHTRMRLTKERVKELGTRVEEIVREFEDTEDHDAPEVDFFWISGVRVEAGEGEDAAEPAPPAPDGAAQERRTA